MNRIPLFRPDVGEQEANAVRRVIGSGWTGTGREVAALENEFSKAVGTKYAVALNSCSAALEFAALGGRIKHVPAMTWPGVYHLARPDLNYYEPGAPWTFVDIDPTGNLPRTGNCTFATNHGGWVQCVGASVAYVEDCAHLPPHKPPRGWKSTIQCWSFHSVKCLSAGDGGMLTTDDQDIAEQCRKWRWFGIDKSTSDRSQEPGYSWRYDIASRGEKRHMNDITAAQVRVQLQRWPEMSERRYAMRWLYSGYGSTEVIEGWHLAQILHEDRDAAMRILGERGIDTGVHYLPPWEFTLWSEVDSSLYPNAKYWGDHVLTLPFGSTYTEHEMERIAKGLEAIA